MKSILNLQRINLTKQRHTLHRVRTALKVHHKGQAALSWLLGCTLVFVPLLSCDWVAAPVQAQDFSCVLDNPNRIFQRCPLGDRNVEQALEDQAINDLLRLYQLAPGERSRLLTHGRNQIRGMLFNRLFELINKPSPTAAEQGALAAFANRIKQKRVQAASFALEEYQRYQNVGHCNYQLPPPLEYNPFVTCSYRGFSNLVGVYPPTFEQFQQAGAVRAYGEMTSSAAQDITRETAQATNFGILVGSTALGAAIGYGIGFAGLAAPLLAAIIPYTFGAKVVGGAAFVAAGSSVGSLVAGPVAVLVASLVISVLAIVQVVEASKTLDKLQAAKTEAENAVIDLRQLIATEAGMQEVYGAFVAATLPDFSETSVPPASPNDRPFLVRAQNSNTTTESAIISYKAWDTTCHTARLNGGWFVDRDQNGNEKMTLSLQTLGTDPVNGFLTLRQAARAGRQFILTNPTAAEVTSKADELPYQDCSGQLKAARIKFGEMTATGNQQIRIGCPLIPTDPQPRVIGQVAGSGDAPGLLSALVNDGGSATAGGITVNNLAVDSQYQITADVYAPNVDAPTSANFTLKVVNGVNQVSTAPFSILKTAFNYYLPERLPNPVSVGASYSAQLIPDDPVVSGCPGGGGDTVTIIDGTLPPGLALQRSGSFNTGWIISGTPTVGGIFTFTLRNTISNGETQTQTYSIIVKTELAELPSGAISWWPGEFNAEDNFARHHGSVVGSVKFARGLTNTAFKFDGSNGYVALPGDTFRPSLDFTFETWFRTSSPGVVLGQQRAVTPYNNPQFGATPAIYIGTDGRLRVQMFNDGAGRLITSQNRVDDNGYHHVAVTYSRTNQLKTVYLDGANIGTLSSFTQGEASNFVYQFGTGYVSNSQLNMFGWFNFKGLIDDPMLYGRVLTTQEIQAIYKAGGAGKISLTLLTAPPDTANGQGGLIIRATGGEPYLMYSADNGQTFQTTGDFSLSPGTYSIVIKDGADNTITRQVTIPNLPPNLVVSATTVNPTCTFATTGRITLTVAGGTGPFQYSVLNGGNVQSSNVFDGLSAQTTYTPWVHDTASGTVATGEPITLTNPPQLTLSPATVPQAVLNEPYSVTFTSGGGTGTRRITAINLPPGLFATATASGLTISGIPEQVGDFFAFVTVKDDNDCPAGRNVNIRVVATACNNATLTPNTASFTANGGTGSINITLPNNCPWSATNNSPGLLTLTGTTSGAGNGTLGYTVAPNPSTTPRTGTITIAGSIFTVQQAGDAQPPTIACPVAQAAVTNNGPVAVNYPPPTANDNLPGVTVACAPPAGANFTVGTTTVNCTARDAASNTAACSFAVTVRQVRPASKDLIAKVRALAPSPLTTAQANQLIGHLEMANTRLERGQTAEACTHLQNFVNGVSTLVSGSQLTAAQGQSLTSYANQIRNAVGCAGSPFLT